MVTILTENNMEKYIGTYKDGFQVAVWAVDINAAKFHLKDWVRLHGKLTIVKKVKKNEVLAA